MPAAAARLPRSDPSGDGRPRAAVAARSAGGSAPGTTTAYAAAIEAVRAAIARGDVYQVEPRAAPVGAVRRRSRRLSPPRSRRCSRSRRRPLAGRGWAIVSASPELFLARRGDRLVTRPIKGTRPAGVDVDDEKDAAEHVMIVDLERNDLSRVCEPGSVHWPELMVQHELAGVTHLVSTVEGRARAGAGARPRSSRRPSPAAR